MKTTGTAASGARLSSPHSVSPEQPGRSVPVSIGIGGAAHRGAVQPGMANPFDSDLSAVANPFDAERVPKPDRQAAADPFFHQMVVADEKVGFQTLMSPPVKVKSG